MSKKDRTSEASPRFRAEVLPYGSASQPGKETSNFCKAPLDPALPRAGSALQQRFASAEQAGQDFLSQSATRGDAGMAWTRQPWQLPQGFILHWPARMLPMLTWMAISDFSKIPQAALSSSAMGLSFPPINLVLGSK